MTTQFIDSTQSLIGTGTDRRIIRCQEITKDFLEDLHCARAASRDMKAAETERVASVPTSLVDSWLAQGIPFWQLTAREIVQRLERDGLHAFLATDKRV